MAVFSAGQQITFSHTGRPCCRAPMFTAGTPKVGVSTTPLEELPSTRAAAAMAERYRLTPRLVRTAAVSGCFSPHASHISLMTCPPASALALVTSQTRPVSRVISSMASSSARAWAAGSAPPAVWG